MAGIEQVDLISLAFFASLIAGMAAAFGYMLGHFTQNPKLLVWAKTEIFQIAVSIVLVFLVLFFVGMLGGSESLGVSDANLLSYGTISAFSSDSVSYEHPGIDSSDSVMDASEEYLKNLAYFSHQAVRGSRSMMGIMDEYSKYTRSPCVPSWLLCLFGASGVSARPISGATSLMQASNLLLYTATASHLTNLAQLFFLSFIRSGLLAIYLPFAIILRSLPGMRPFGGGLLAICVSLFVIYPALLYMESSFWSPWALIDDTNSWERVSEFSSTVEDEGGDAAAMGDLFYQYGNYSYDTAQNYFENLLQVISASFLSSTFLFTLNITVISAAAVLFGRLLGAEVDLSRLMQIV